MAKKKCRACGVRKDESEMIQVPLGFFCDVECASVHARKQADKARDRAAKKKSAERRKAVRDLKLNDRSHQLRLAQQVFNRWIREVRDAGKPCISCGRHHQGQYHAGHYRTVGANPELRFEPLNCHKQCAPCNNHMSGNITNYRINLIKRIGKDKVDWLEGPHEPKKYTCEELVELRSYYSKLIRDAQ